MTLLSKKEIGAKVTKLDKREQVTKVLLAELSREALEYVYKTADIGLVNRLINVLTPVNKKVACAFFESFVGWTFDKETSQFGTKKKEKPFTKLSYASDDFLSNADNNIWTWADKEIEVKAKAKNYAMKIGKLVDKALTDSDEGINLKEVLFAIMASDAVNLNDLMHSLDDVVNVEVKEAA
jgi:hypothetical protein